VSIRGTALHTLAGAYALHALDDAERARFERHLARCDACVQEVAGLRDTAALLGSAASAEPPEPLRARVLTAAAGTRQHPPPTPGERRARSRPARRAGQVRQPRPPWRRSLRTALAATVAATAAVAAVVAVLAVMTVTARHRLADAQRRGGEVAAVLTAKDAQMMTAPVTTGGSATVVMSHAKRMIVFSAAGLRTLPGAMSYELWLMGPAGVRPAGMLPRPSHGMTAPMVASGLAPGDKVGLTVEPETGSSRPTTPPVLMLPLSS
jgi:anti-sigma-K factor RskA